MKLLVFICLLASPALAVPTVVQYAASGMERSSNLGTFTASFPELVGSGNLLVVCLAADASSTFPAPTDDKGNTYVTAASLTNSTNQTVTLYYAMNAVSGTRTITAPCNGGNCVTSGNMKIAEFAGIATASALDVGGNNNLSTASQSVALTTTVDGDLIFLCSNDTAAAPTITSLTANGSGIPMNADYQGGNWMSYQVQAAHGAISPGFTQSGTNNWTSVAASFKPAAAGTPRPAGMMINSIQHSPLPTGTSTTTKFPCTGNLISLIFNSGDVHLSAVSSVPSNTWAQLPTESNLVDGGAISDIWYAVNATCSVDLVLTLTYSGVSAGTNHAVIYDISGAATSPLDTSDHSNGDQVASGNLTTHTVTPTGTNGGIIISTVAVSWHTEKSVSTSGWSTDVFLNSLDDNASGVGPQPPCWDTPPSQLDEDNGYAHKKWSGSSSAETVVWVSTDTGLCGKLGIGSFAAHTIVFDAPAPPVVVVSNASASIPSPDVSFVTPYIALQSVTVIAAQSPVIVAASWLQPGVTLVCQAISATPIGVTVTDVSDGSATLLLDSTSDQPLDSPSITCLGGTPQ